MELTDEERAAIMMFRTGEFRLRLEAKDRTLSEEAATVALAPLVAAAGKPVLHMDLDHSDIYEVGAAEQIQAVVVAHKPEVQADADA